MKKNYTYLKKHEITFEWIIKDFDVYLTLYNNEIPNYALYSSSFSADQEVKDRFHLGMDFELNSINFFLCWKKYETEKKMKYQVCILGENRQKYREITGYNQPIQSNSNQCNFGQYNQHSSSTKNDHATHIQSTRLNCTKMNLIMASKRLFPHNNFTVVCYLVVYEQPANISPTYVRKPYQSMKLHFQKLWEDEIGSDMTFEVGDKELKAHKSVLIARSPVFLAMFQHDMLENNTNRAKIVDINPEIFKLMLKFIYTDRLKNRLSEKDTIELLEAAAKYQLDGLQSICEEKLFYLLTVNNVMDFLLTAEKHNFAQLVSSIEDFIEVHKSEILASIDQNYFLLNPHHIHLFCQKKVSFTAPEEMSFKACNNEPLYSSDDD